MAKDCNAVNAVCGEAENRAGAASFTRIAYSDPRPVGKTAKMPAGALITENTGALIRGRARTVQVENLTEFAQVLKDLRPGRDVLTFGIPKGSEPDTGWGIVTDARHKKLMNRGRAASIIPRTKGHFHWPEGRGLVLLDYDPAEGAEGLDAQDLLAKLVGAVPALGQCQSLWWPSSSSHIHDAEGNNLTGQRGWRGYIIADNAADIPRAMKAAIGHLWLAKYGRIDISKSGNLLVRTLLDALVWQAERVDYAAGATCLDGLVQRRGEPILMNPDQPPTLDTTLILDLTKKQKKSVDDRVDYAKEKREAEAKAIREAYDEAKADDYVKAERAKNPALTDAQAEQIRTRVKASLDRARQTQILSSDFVLHFDDGMVMPVRDLFRPDCDRAGETLADPLEPDRRGKAQIYDNGPNGWFIHSYAHGGQNFRVLPDAEDAARALAEAEGIADPVAAMAAARHAELIIRLAVDLSDDDKMMFAQRLSKIIAAGGAAMVKGTAARGDDEIPHARRKQDAALASNPKNEMPPALPTVAGYVWYAPKEKIIALDTKGRAVMMTVDGARGLWDGHEVYDGDSVKNPVDVWMRTRAKNKTLRLPALDPRYSPGWNPTGDGLGWINVFAPFVPLADVDDAEPTDFLRLIRHVFPHEGDAEWVMQWMGYKLRNPHARMTALVSVATVMGSGRNTVFEIMRRLVGGNCSTIMANRLFGKQASQFNSHLADNLLLTIGEVEEGDAGNENYRVSRAVFGRLKELVDPDERTVLVERKGYDGQTAEIFTSFMIATNSSGALPLVEGDRRFSVLGGNTQMLHDVMPDIVTWQGRIRGGDEIELTKVYRYLTEKVDLSNFNPREPRETSAKRAMISDGKSRYDEMIEEILRLGEPDPCWIVSAPYIAERMLRLEPSADESKLLYIARDWLTNRSTVAACASPNTGQLKVKGEIHRPRVLDRFADRNRIERVEDQKAEYLRWLAEPSDYKKPKGEVVDLDEARQERARQDDEISRVLSGRAKQEQKLSERASVTMPSTDPDPVPPKGTGRRRRRPAN
ncbi:primase-helicase family protein [Paracoccus ravus]|uniref:primase-helicase family protein n=1 Tax=Paracoccus ravus TaxID=2447760 RepID=UPI00106EA261|nr:primase-helicase family protein [Paracoccus ravus]